MHLRAGLLLLAFLWSGCEQAAPPAEAPPPGPSAEEAPPEPGSGGDPVVIVARVLESPRPPPCGDQTYRVAVEYEVLRVEEGTLSEHEILVRQSCVERARLVGDAGPIAVGDVHRLTLDPEPYRTQRRVQWLPRRTDRAAP